MRGREDEFGRGDDDFEDEDGQAGDGENEDEPDPDDDDLPAEDGDDEDDDEDGDDGEEGDDDPPRRGAKAASARARRRGEHDAMDAEDHQALAEPHEQHFSCPHCGEPVSVILDPDGAGDGADIEEDCEVCCRTMAIHYRVEDGLVVEFSADEG